MVSTRGVKYKFSVGERVLCYEPDPTKAKVLYESKVLELVVTRDGRGRKVPEYRIHFFGWNSSWDRNVREEFILPYTEENRELQTKLATDAALSMKGKRKSKLPPLIKETLSKKKCLESENQENKEPESSSDSSSETESSEEEMDKEIFINIPDVLKAQLEEDWRCITQRDKFVKLPCEPNVIAILEAYVKHLAAKLLCASPPKNVKNGKHLMPDDVKNKLNLSKEAMDGIRVYFDFTLPHLLLYRQEKKQYYTIGMICSPVSDEKNSEQPKEEQKPIIKKEIEGSPGESSGTLNKDASVAKKEAEIPAQNRSQRSRLNLRNQSVKCSQSLKAENGVNGVFDSKLGTPLYTDKMTKKITKEKPKAACTRILRSSDKQKQPVSPEETSSNLSSPLTRTDSSPVKVDSPVSQVESESHAEPCRVTRKSVRSPPPPMSNHPFQTSQSIADKTALSCLTAYHPFSQVLPSLSAASNYMSSSNSSSHSSLSSPLFQGQQYHLINNSGLLEEVLSWRMLPQHLYEQMPAAPSLIYGVQHLLRLFVKLPDLISKMGMSDRKLDPLLNILENFLLYIAEKKDELFLSSAYVDSSEVFPDGCLSAVK